MIKAILTGCNGFMGKVVTDICAADDAIEIVAGVDINTEAKAGYPVFASFADVNVEADVIIDFSHISVLDSMFAFCAEKKMPAVVCTTGLTDAQMDALKALGSQTAVLKSANMSLGINTLMAILKSAVKVFGPAGFDVEIVEKHHNRKLDAPSGTAIALADSINEAMDNQYEYIYDRSTRRQKRDKKELGISAVRGGNIVGEHEVIFAGQDEVITFTHTAYSRGVFAKGAVEAAKFLVNAQPGLYDMADVIAANV